MKRFIASALLYTPFIASAAGTVDFLEVHNDTVLFSTTEAKASASPACVTAENTDLWSVSLASDSGRAIYSLILTAMSKGNGMGLSVSSANDCGVTSGVERANKVNLVSTATSGNASKSAGVYKADGVTRLGTLVDFTDRGAYRYVTSEAIGGPTYYVVPNNSTFYFESDDCSGQPYTTSGNADTVRNRLILDGAFLSAGPDRVLRSMRSAHNGSSCRADVDNKYVYDLVPAEHPICGENVCMVKED